MQYLPVAEIRQRQGEAAMRWTIERDAKLLRQDRVTDAWAAQLEGKRLAADIAEPDYGDPHPTPGAAKVPEIIQGFFLHSRI